MNFTTLKYLCAIAEEQSITKAAQKLLISQPSLSYHVLKLEKELGVDLFDRSKVPLSLTVAGEKYLESARKILVIKNSIEKELGSVKEIKQEKLTVSMNSFRVLMQLPKILDHLRENYPYVIFDLYCTTSFQAEQAVLQGKSDLAIFGKLDKSKMDSNLLVYKHIVSEKILLALPPIDAIAYSQENLQNKSFFVNEDCILYVKGSRIREITDYFFEINCIKPKIILETISSTDILRFCGQGLGYSFISESVPEYYHILPQPKYFYLNEIALTSSIIVCWKKGAQLSWFKREFINMLDKFLTSTIAPKFPFDVTCFEELK